MIAEKIEAPALNKTNLIEIFSVGKKVKLFVFSFFFSSKKMSMDPIFKNNTNLKKEYCKMVNDLPLLNECGYCEKLEGRYYFSVNCGMCIRERCKNCHNFNRSKDILINCEDKQISDYVQNFLLDYFSASGLSSYFFKIDITNEVKEKNAINIIIKNENKIIKTIKKEKTNKILYYKSKKYRNYYKL